jgi:CDP-diacylglycerol--glycerol-3-phosphate 3-phosphatidyltransferase
VIDLRFRDAINKVTDPLGRGLVRVHLSADVITFIGLGVSVVAAWQATEGHLIVAALLGIAACLCDLMDGAAAKAAGSASVRGAYLDSMADRVSESIMYLALVVYCLRFRTTGLAYVVIVTFIAAQLTSYARAKADALGVDGKVGLMERAERQVAMGLAALIPHAFAPIMWFMAISCSITAVQRMVVVWTRLPARTGPATPPSVRVLHRPAAPRTGRRRAVR